MTTLPLDWWRLLWVAPSAMYYVGVLSLLWLFCECIQTYVSHSKVMYCIFSNCITRKPHFGFSWKFKKIYTYIKAFDRTLIFHSVLKSNNFILSCFRIWLFQIKDPNTCFFISDHLTYTVIGTHSMAISNWLGDGECKLQVP